MPLADAMKLTRLCRGCLSVSNSAKNGRKYHCLQYRKGTRHVSRYVPADRLEAYREATENYRLFMDAVDKYVDELSAETEKSIEVESRKTQKSAGNGTHAPGRRKPGEG